MNWAQPLLEWVSSHPLWALAFVFVASLLDALLFVGILVPAAFILFGVGALVALGSVGFVEVLLAAATGAIAGDTLNYWLGRRYGARALRSAVAQRYADGIDRSRRFFDRHGTKSIFLSRFIGLVRPFVPAIAGAYGMPPLTFAAVEVVAGLAWAFVFMLPGMAVGASIGLAAEVATRLSVLLLAIVALVWVLVAATRIAVRYAQGHAEGWISALLDWSHRHRRVGRLGEWLADPDQPETPALLIMAVALLAGGWLWLFVWWGLGRHHPLPFDAIAYQTLQDLHTPWGLAIAGALSAIGAWEVTMSVAAALIATLLWLRQPRAALHALAAIMFGGVISLGLYIVVRLPDPWHYYAGDLSARFSGGDLVLAAMIYGLIPVLLATGRSTQLRTLYYGIAVVVLGLIGGAQLYLGAQWASVSLFAVIVGGLWLTVLGVGYRRHHPYRLPGRRLLVPVFAVFAVAVSMIGSTATQAFDVRPEPQMRMVTMEQWWHGAFAAHPAIRSDVAGLPKLPLNLQWAGRLSDIAAALTADGWTVPTPLALTSALRWLSPGAPLADLPVLPQVHAGQHQVLIMHKPAAADRQWVARLWPSGWTLDGAPLWIGSLTHMSSRRLLGFAQIPYTRREFPLPESVYGGEPSRFVSTIAHHPGYTGSLRGWDGRVFLARPPPRPVRR